MRVRTYNTDSVAFGNVNAIRITNILIFLRGRFVVFIACV